MGNCQEYADQMAHYKPNIIQTLDQKAEAKSCNVRNRCGRVQDYQKRTEAKDSSSTTSYNGIIIIERNYNDRES
jgi:hypothetical protein